MIIAVTGASGFIGTELLAELNKRDDVSVIALTRGDAAVTPYMAAAIGTSQGDATATGGEVLLYTAAARG